MYNKRDAGLEYWHSGLAPRFFIRTCYGAKWLQSLFCVSLDAFFEES